MITNDDKIDMENYIPYKEAFKDIIKEPIPFGETLSILRSFEGKNQSDFAKMIGISRGNLCDIEKGRKGVSPERAAQFAKKLGYPVSYLVEIALNDIANDLLKPLKLAVQKIELKKINKTVAKKRAS